MGGRFESNSQSIVGGLSGSIQLQRVAENPSPLREVADGIWEATWYDPDAHNKVSAFIEKGIKPENRERFSQCLKMYDAGNLPPCSYVDRMVIFDMPAKVGGVCVYNAIPITKEFRDFCIKQGGVSLIIIPNSEHAQHQKGWMDAFPTAMVICPGGETMEKVIYDLGDAAKVMDAQKVYKWNKDATRMLVGTGVEVMDVAGFQEIILSHRKSKSFISCDSIYLGCANKIDKTGWPNFPAPEWRDHYFQAFIEGSTCHLPIFRTNLTAEQKKSVSLTLKKVHGWKAERVMSSRSGKTSTGGPNETVRILDAHWAWVNNE